MLLQMFFGIWLKQWTNGAFYLPMSGAGGPDRPIPFVGVPHPAGHHAGLGLDRVRGAHHAQPAARGAAGSDYIRTAHAKGLSDRAVLWRHSMKNALIPVVTFIAWISAR